MRSSASAERPRPVLQLDQPLDVDVVALLVEARLQREDRGLQHRDAGEARCRVGVQRRGGHGRGRARPAASTPLARSTAAITIGALSIRSAIRGLSWRCTCRLCSQRRNTVHRAVGLARARPRSVSTIWSGFCSAKASWAAVA